MKKTAKKHKVTHQLEVLTKGGTDTAAAQRHSAGGSIAGGISIPCRYLHQVIEMVHKSDVRESIDMLKHCLTDINKYDWSFK